MPRASPGCKPLVAILTNIGTMIKKIISIKNFGKFTDPTFGKGNWNGVLEQTNVIFANNGSGKTTLSLLFRSLKGNNQLIIKKKSFSSSENPSIVLLNDQNKEHKFANSRWNKYETNIEIFDSFFIEDNVYLITLKDNSRSQTIFEILLGEENIKIKKEISAIEAEIKKNTNKRNNLRNKRNSAKLPADKKRFQDLMDKLALDKQSHFLKIKDLESQLVHLSKSHHEEYLQKINSYLRLFNPNLRLNKLTQFKNRVIYTLEINGHSLKTEDKFYSLRYSLSDGDKNALSLSFFLAKLDMLPNLGDQTVVIDDPITSFDYARKNTTINKLLALSKKVKMFILLSHDLVFANEFSRRLDYKCNNLKIEYNGTTSYILKHDIELESLTGVFKDLTVLHDYLNNGASSDMEKRDIARCVRPVLEGVFRIKFFKEIDRTEWLGDILGKIRDSQDGTTFFHLKNLLSELSEINDYSKEYHHSNPYYFETPINDAELRNYVSRTIEVLRVV